MSLAGRDFPPGVQLPATIRPGGWIGKVGVHGRVQWWKGSRAFEHGFQLDTEEWAQRWAALIYNSSSQCFFFFLVKRDDMPQETSSFLALICISWPEWSCTSVMAEVEGCLFVPSCTSVWCIIHRNRVFVHLRMSSAKLEACQFLPVGHLLIVCLDKLSAPWTLLSAFLCAVQQGLYTDGGIYCSLNIYPLSPEEGWNRKCFQCCKSTDCHWYR